MHDSQQERQFFEQANRRLALVRDNDLLHEALEQMRRRYVQFRETEKLLPAPNRMSPAPVPPGMDRATLNKNFFADVERIAVRAEALQSERNKKRQQWRVKTLQKQRDDDKNRDRLDPARPQDRVRVMIETQDIAVRDIAPNMDHEDGRRLKAAIDTALRCGRNVRIDFKGVDIVTPSLLNTSFRPLAREYSRDHLKDRITIVNGNSLVNRMLREALAPDRNKDDDGRSR